ncbi:MAG: hypothetical protein AAFR01_03710, partial [Pseudomonadota bacterium]
VSFVTGGGSPHILLFCMSSDPATACPPKNKIDLSNTARATGFNIQLCMISNLHAVSDFSLDINNI